MIKLKIREDIYYEHKKSFKILYKSLGLAWMENTKVGDVWTNKDFSSYLRKVPEESGYKRFYSYECQPMVDFLLGIGAEIIPDDKIEPVVQKVNEPINYEQYKGYKNFRELLESAPDNWGVTWGDSLSSSNMSDTFKNRWRELDIKYKDYRFENVLEEMKEKNKRRRKELGIEEDIDEDKEVVMKRRTENDILPTKTSKKKSKITKIKPVKVESNLVKIEFKKKVFKITKK